MPYVSDEMLTESSFYCDNSPDEGCQSTGLTDGMSAKYARLNSTGYLTSNWAAQINDMNQYIQVCKHVIRRTVYFIRSPASCEKGPSDIFKKV